MEHIVSILLPVLCGWGVVITCDALEDLAQRQWRAVPLTLAPLAALALMLALFARVSASPGPVAALRLASGCAAWERFTAVQIDGIHRGLGLDGTFDRSIDTQNGRSVTRWQSGDLIRASGYDGTASWSRDFSAGTHTMNAPSAVALARTQAWMDARGWCSDGSAVYRSRGSAPTVKGAVLDAIAVRPAGGATITLFIDRASHLIDRTLVQLDEDHELTEYSDWRTVDGVAVPYQTRIGSAEYGNSETWIVRSYRSRAMFPASAFAAPLTDPDIVLPRGSTQVSVPYVLDGIKPIVNVLVNGKGPFPFVIDTGAHFILTPMTAAAAGVHQRGAVNSLNQGTIAHAGFARVDCLQIGAAVISNQVAKINPYSFAKLERGPRSPKAGWLGLELFERFAVTFDPVHRMVTLRPLNAPRPIAPGTKVPLTFDEDAPLAPCGIDGKPGTCMLDTGNSGSTIVAETWARRTGVASKLADGLNVGGELISRASISIGPFDRPGALVSYAPAGMAYAETYNVESGILSEALIDGFVATFDYGRMGLWLVPAGRYVPMPFNRSGVIAAKTPQGPFVVRYVIAGSPASAAGIRPGDTILSVDDVPATQLSGADFSRANATEKPSIDYALLRGSSNRNVRLLLRDLLPADSQH